MRALARRLWAALALLLLAALLIAPAHAELMGGLTFPKGGKRLLFTNDRTACTDPDKEGDVYLVSETKELIDAGCWWRRGDSVLIGPAAPHPSIYVLPARAVQWLAPDSNKPKPAT